MLFTNDTKTGNIPSVIFLDTFKVTCVIFYTIFINISSLVLNLVPINMQILHRKSQKFKYSMLFFYKVIKLCKK